MPTLINWTLIWQITNQCKISVKNSLSKNWGSQTMHYYIYLSLCISIYLYYVCLYVMCAFISAHLLINKKVLFILVVHVQKAHILYLCNHCGIIYNPIFYGIIHTNTKPASLLAWPVYNLIRKTGKTWLCKISVAQYAKMWSWRILHYLCGSNSNFKNE